MTKLTTVHFHANNGEVWVITVGCGVFIGFTLGSHSSSPAHTRTMEWRSGLNMLFNQTSTVNMWPWIVQNELDGLFHVERLQLSWRDRPHPLIWSGSGFQTAKFLLLVSSTMLCYFNKMPALLSGSQAHLWTRNEELLRTNGAQFK